MTAYNSRNMPKVVLSGLLVVTMVLSLFPAVLSGFTLQIDPLKFKEGIRRYLVLNLICVLIFAGVLMKSAKTNWYSIFD